MPTFYRTVVIWKYLFMDQTYVCLSRINFCRVMTGLLSRFIFTRGVATMKKRNVYTRIFFFLLGMANLQAQAMNTSDFNGDGLSDLGQVCSESRRLSLSVLPSDQTGFTEIMGLKWLFDELWRLFDRYWSSLFKMIWYLYLQLKTSCKWFCE